MMWFAYGSAIFLALIVLVLVLAGFKRGLLADRAYDTSIEDFFAELATNRDSEETAIRAQWDANRACTCTLPATGPGDVHIGDRGCPTHGHGGTT